MSKKFLALFLSVSIVLSVFLFSIPVNASSDIEGSSLSITAIDLNGDGFITLEDIFWIIGNGFNTKVGDAAYNEKSDLNNDGAINMCDVFLILRYIGQATINSQH